MLKIQHTLALFAVAALASSALADFVETQDQTQKQQDQVVAQQNAVQECVTLHAQGKKDEARTKLALIVAKNPSMGETADVMRLGWLATDDPKAWEKKVVSISKSGDKRKEDMLGMFAWNEVCSKTGKPLAKKTVKLAVNASNHKSVYLLFWAVMIYSKTTDYQLGLDSVNTLFKVLPTSPEKNNSRLIKQMDEKKAELESKVKTKG